MPGFTAEATLHKRSECYHQKEGDIAASRNGAGILPAVKIRNIGPGAVRSICMQEGGLFFPYNRGVVGCFFPDGSGNLLWRREAGRREQLRSVGS